MSAWLKRSAEKGPQFVTQRPKPGGVRCPADGAEHFGFGRDAGHRCIPQRRNQAGIAVPESPCVHLGAEIADSSIDQRRNPLREAICLRCVQPADLAHEAEEGRAPNRRSEHRTDHGVDAIKRIIGRRADCGVDDHDEFGGNLLEDSVDQRFL